MKKSESGKAKDAENFEGKNEAKIGSRQVKVGSWKIEKAKNEDDNDGVPLGAQDINESSLGALGEA